MKSKSTTNAILSLISLVCVFGCSPDPIVPFQWVYKEVKRIGSPDLKVEAVIMTGDAGAVTSEETYIFIVPTGKTLKTNTVDQSEAVFMRDHLKGFNVSWRQDNLLAIKYDLARIDRFRNHFDVYGSSKYTYPVEIRLEPTSSDSSLPAEDKQPIQIK
jgi:hypothetical protein